MQSFVLLIILLSVQIYLTLDAQEKAPGNISPVIRFLLNEIKSRGITTENIQSSDMSALSTPKVHIDSAGRIHVYINLSSTNDEQLSKLRELDFDIELTNHELKITQGWLPFDQIESAAALAFVIKITPPGYGSPMMGSSYTQGDTILKSDQLRQLGVNGTGIKVGVISDGANAKSAAQATGDLPQSITSYGTCTPRPFDGFQCDSGRTCNEGTAMLEIVHDIAPDAQLAMGAVNTSLEFVDRINDLVNNFGADIIVDDLGFYGEPYFEDGMVAQAVANVADDLVYITSAGNSALGHYEGQFVPVTYLESSVHDFGQASGSTTDATMNIAIAPGHYILTIAQWNDQYSASGNDYDIYLLNEDENDLLCAECGSILPQSGFHDPIEGICYYNETEETVTGKLVVEKYSGADKRLEIFLLGSSGNEYNVADGSIFGHAGIPDVVTVGAINAGDPGNENIAPYSSRGPARIDYPVVQIRPKPTVTAIDGVSVTGAGGFPQTFFGTSASAPHVAGVVALLLSGLPDTSTETIRLALSESADDFGASGFDSTYGSGRIEALSALFAIAPDTDNDNVVDIFDNCPDHMNFNQTNTDSDLSGDACDIDDDNDGMTDIYELANGLNPLMNDADLDIDFDSLTNYYEFTLGTSANRLDTDYDGTADNMELAVGRNPLVNEPAVIFLINSQFD